MIYKKYLIFVFFVFASLMSFATNLYVAPNGDDINDGSFSKPIESIERAQELASAGDTVYIMGGIYQMRENQIAKFRRNYAHVTELYKSGIAYHAYANEVPVFDFTNVKPLNKRITAFYITGDNIHIKGIQITGVQVTIKRHTQSECFKIQGGNNTILENIKMHHNMAIGVYILRGSNNLILNCDAYENWDSVSEGGKGGNTDGFGCHVPKGSVNNVFRGCRAWLNSDDGFDLINNAEPVLIDHCWAFYNGYSKSPNSLMEPNNFVSRADGNGFKAGGYGKGGRSFKSIMDQFVPIPKNTIQFCLAVGNKQSGFYANHHLEGNYWYNNTAYRNKRNYSMLNCKALTPEDYATDVPGWNHVMINNLGAEGDHGELTSIDKLKCTLKNNYFDMNIKVTSSDFISIDESLLTAKRQVDGSLPNINSFRLSPKSKFINAGLDIGFSFFGVAPDLGCFESED
ncbi:right-handed parallel beta-helix repeat-containing protein [Wenyingzhuangia sp. IMCC45467]